MEVNIRAARHLWMAEGSRVVGERMERRTRSRRRAEAPLTPQPAGTSRDGRGHCCPRHDNFKGWNEPVTTRINLSLLAVDVVLNSPVNTTLIQEYESLVPGQIQRPLRFFGLS